jgi:hypothetical protein
MHLYASFEMHLATLETFSSMQQFFTNIPSHTPFHLQKCTQVAPNLPPKQLLKTPNSTLATHKPPPKSVLKNSPKSVPQNFTNSSLLATCNLQICHKSALNFILTLQKFREQDNLTTKWHNKEETRKNET